MLPRNLKALVPKKNNFKGLNHYFLDKDMNMERDMDIDMNLLIM
jgi:hypothetical protein